MKKLFTLLIATAIGTLLCFSLVSCGECEHTYGEWITDRAATESEVGERHRECTKCGDKITEEIPKLAHTHTYAEAWSYDDTYHWHDSTCGHDPIGKTAHTYGDWIIDREATEDAAGAKHRVCTVCDKVENVAIPELSHTHKYASTWSYDSTYHWHASTCGHTDAVIDKEKHDFGESGICKCGAKDESISVKVYIDGTLTDTLHTGLAYGFRITPPEKPEDITTNPNSEKYFYAWFTDANFQTPLLDTTEFRANGAIYAKWVTVCSNDFRYTVSEGKATIVSLSVTSTATTTLVIPAYINGFPVTTIGKDAFANNTFIRTLILCDGIQSIGVSAFSGCNSMTHVELPKSLTTIGEKAFQGCSTLPDISIPENVTSIGSSAFSGCTRLTSITIPFVGAKKNGTGNTHFGYIFGASSPTNNKWHVPSGLKTVVITRGTSIGDSAFYDCAGFTSITIPDSVTNIDISAFSGCSGLTSITISDGNKKYHSDGNCLIETETKVLLRGCNASVISADGSVTSIGVAAFFGCTGLTSVTIPSSVTSIGEAAFSSCRGLTSITIPNGVTSIGDSAFYGCTGLKDIYYTGNYYAWNAMPKGSNWNYNTGNYTIHYNYKSEE